MKILQLVIGIPLTLFGLVMVTGTILSMLDASSKYSLVENITFTLLLGVLPFVGGLYLCRLATKKNSVEDTRL